MKAYQWPSIPAGSSALCRGGGRFAMRVHWRDESIIIDNAAAWLDDPTIRRHVQTS
jgi:hypothetical protein